MELVIQFCIDFFITSLPETIFLFLFLIFTTSLKKDYLNDVVSYILVLNVISYIIIGICNMTQLLETLLFISTIMIGVLVYNRANISKVIMYSIIGTIATVITQLVVVIPMSIIFQVSTETITATPYLCAIFQLILRPIQILVLLKLYLIKRRLNNV